MRENSKTYSSAKREVSAYVESPAWSSLVARQAHNPASAGPRVQIPPPQPSLHQRLPASLLCNFAVGGLFREHRSTDAHSQISPQNFDSFGCDFFNRGML